MEFVTRFIRKTRNTNPDPDPRDAGEADEGEAAPPPSEETASFGGREIIAGDTEGRETTSLVPSGDGERQRALMESPPTDDVCPICFGSFDIPCRATCGHWYCGSCILQYWNFSAALQPCKCPMCSQLITKLTPHSSLSDVHEVEISKVLKGVGDYNRLFVGGISGLLLKLLALPLYIKRMSRDLLNPDRPGHYLHELRLIALFLGVLYSMSPFDFLGIGRRNIIDIFDYSAFGLSLILYVVGIYLRRRRARNVRELAEI